MELLLLILKDYTFQVVALGTGILGFLSGVVGSFAVLRKESLLGDSLSHAALPGIVIGFLLIGYKDWRIILLGAAISGLLATAIIRWMSQAIVKLDSALALILSSFFGFGLVLLTVAQKSPNANQAGLENFIYGQASGMLQSDVYAILVAGIVIVALILLFWKELKILTFDAIFAQTLGFNVKGLQFLLSVMLVVVVILGLESVGVILMSALLVAPAVAARQWTTRLSSMVGLAGIFGGISGVTGTFISSYYPKMPTGPTIVIVASIFVLFSIFFAPRRGLIAKGIQYSRRKRKYQALLQKNKNVGGA